MADDLRGRLAELLPSREHVVERLAEHPFGGEQNYLELAAELWALVDEYASLPACSECGGRPKRGLIRSEDDQAWQCEGCFCAFVREPDPIDGSA